MGTELLKVIIVDDEKLIRQLLRNCINWGKFGFRLIAEASGSMEAIDLVDEHVPDIIFTDICMPFVDGIELSRIVLEKYPGIKIIIVTGHEKFEYAKQSIRLGITDFLLKPINNDEIIKVLSNIKKVLEEEKLHWKEYDKLKKQLEEDLPYLKEKYLNNLLTGTLSLEDIHRKSEYFNIHLKSEWSQIAVIYNSCQDSKNIEEDVLISRLNALEYSKEYFKDKSDIYLFLNNDDKIIILNNNKVIKLTEECEILKTKLINRLNCNVSIGIGNPYNTFYDISLSYNEACDALKYRIIEGSNNVIHYNDIYFSNDKKVIIKNKSINDLKFYLKIGVYSISANIIEQMLDEKEIGKSIDIQSIRVIASNIISVILNIIMNTEINIRSIFTGPEPYEHIFKIETLPEMIEYLKELALALTDLINNLKTNKTNRLISEIKDYIIENISNYDLILYNLADEFTLNPSYLSRKFKKETGKTFIEYVSKLRIKKAVKLLKETDLKNYQIAEEIGIADPHYFSIFFKKYLNMSISDYRKKIEQ